MMPDRSSTLQPAVRTRRRAEAARSGPFLLLLLLDFEVRGKDDGVVRLSFEMPEPLTEVTEEQQGDSSPQQRAELS